MEIVNTGCCAIAEIRNLRGATPRNAMIAFCQQSLTPNRLRHAGQAPAHERVFSYYLFTAGVGEYGKNFERFIADHKLGEVWASPKRPNWAFYNGSHDNQIWIWMPDSVRLVEWWKKNDPSASVVAAVKAKF